MILDMEMYLYIDMYPNKPKFINRPPAIVLYLYIH